MPFNPLQRIQSRAWVIARGNIDTDIIFPARFLLHLQREGMGRFAFHDWCGEGASDNADFPHGLLDEPGRQVLIAGPNFGCGSSREQAVWALADLGLRCIIAPSFGDIFYNNCFNNGVLPITLPEASWQQVLAAARADASLTIDLQTQSIDLPSTSTRYATVTISFEVSAFHRDSLLNGWDAIDRSLEQDSDAILAYETRRREQQPWLFRALD